MAETSLDQIPVAGVTPGDLVGLIVHRNALATSIKRLAEMNSEPHLETIREEMARLVQLDKEILRISQPESEKPA